MSDSQSPPIQVLGIDHVTLVVKDLEASRALYVDALGMKQVPRPNFSFEGLWFQAGDTLIHLILEHAESGSAGIFKPEEPLHSRTHHIAFRVDNGEVAYQRVQELGLEIVSPPKARPDGAYQFFIADPDNHVVELFSM